MHRGLLGFLLAAFVLLTAAPQAGASHVTRGEIRWACGFGERSPEGCGIDAIMEPSFTTRSWIDPDDLVIGIATGGEARAYPVRMLDAHEIVNDNIGGRAIAVTWCPLCGSALVFERLVDVDGTKRVVTFDVSGYLYKHDLVMWQEGNGLLWTQIKGEPIATLEDESVKATHPEGTLAVVSSELMTWGEWRALHPASKMLSNNGRSYSGSYVGYDADCRIGVYGDDDCDIDGLHPKEQVVGVSHEDGAVAFPAFGLERQGAPVVHEQNGRAIVAVASERGIEVFDGGDRTFEQRDGTWKDAEGHVWLLEQGIRADGAETLATLEHVVLFWFAWNEHHPDTDLWLPDDLTGQRPPRDPGLLPGPALPLSVFALVVALALLRAAKRERG